MVLWLGRGPVPRSRNTPLWLKDVPRARRHWSSKFGSKDRPRGGAKRGRPLSDHEVVRGNTLFYNRTFGPHVSCGGWSVTHRSIAMAAVLLTTTKHRSRRTRRLVTCAARPRAIRPNGAERVGTTFFYFLLQRQRRLNWRVSSRYARRSAATPQEPRRRLPPQGESARDG